jgi:hypothetical protein
MLVNFLRAPRRNHEEQETAARQYRATLTDILVQLVDARTTTIVEGSEPVLTSERWRVFVQSEERKYRNMLKRQARAKAVIRRFVQRFMMRYNIQEVIAMQHEEMVCKICYDYEGSLFIKCKTCKSGEYHQDCMDTWTASFAAGGATEKQLEAKKSCLLCKSLL